MFGSSRFPTPAEPLLSQAKGVGHPVRSLPDMRRPEARSAQIDRPEGIARRFHVRLYNVEPSESVFARNLLANCNDRSAGEAQFVKDGPKMSLVSEARAFAGCAERLAGEACGPDRAIVGPAGAAQGVGPHSDACEEVALIKSSKFIWPNIADVPFVYDAGSDVARSDEFAQPCRSEWIDLVVVGSPLPTCADSGGHAAWPCSTGAREAAAASASSWRDAFLSDAKPAQCSAGMLSRAIHDRTVWTDTLRLKAVWDNVPAAFTMSRCVLIPT
jgi:hypothetical protein